MTEINPNNIRLADLTPEQKAKLLEDLSKESLPKLSHPDEENNELKSQPDKASVDIEVAESKPIEKDNIITFKRPTGEKSGQEEKAKNVKSKGILNKFFEGNESFEDVHVTLENADQAMQETIDQSDLPKAA